VTVSRAVYLGEGPDWSFGLTDAPVDASRSGTGVLICGPWGWEEVASYRGRREWAHQLAASGHTVLRLDLPGVGDGGGRPRDPRLVGSWAEAIAAAAGWLRTSAGCGRVVVIGLGLGGLLAGKALDEGARFDELVFWSTPAKGRSFVRTQRAFSRLQTSQYTLVGELESDLPEGWLESGGFVLTAETMAAIEDIRVADLDLSGLRRALVLDHDGIAADTALTDALDAAGVEVVQRPGPGWDAMTGHPEQYRPATEVFTAVGGWIADGSGGDASPPDAATTVTEVLFDWDGSPLREQALEDQPLFGILTEPVDAPDTDLCAVFLNAGAIRRPGPNRIWTEAARRFAARGVPSFRVDFAAIGEADGDASRYSQASEFYTPELGAQVADALDLLEMRGLGPRFLLTGLCSGSYWAFHASIDDPRIVSACLLNPRILFWDDEVETARDARTLTRLLRPVWWRKLLSGYVSLGRMREILAATVKSVVGAIRTRFARGPEPELGMEEALDAIAASGTRLVLAFSGDEPLEDELRRDGVMDGGERWPNLRHVSLPARDHELRPLPAQRAAHELLDAELRAVQDVVRAT
jgi:pimeloyl-ACP methyl ester carboxylesterase